MAKNKTVAFKTDQKLLEALSNKAALQGVSVSTLCESILRDKLFPQLDPELQIQPPKPIKAASNPIAEVVGIVWDAYRNDS